MSILLSLLLVLFKMSETTPNLEVSQGNAQISKDLYKVFCETEGNVFFSPISIHAVLSMILQGAQGSTLEKLASTLHVANAKSAAESYQSVINRLNNVDKVTLLMANKMFAMHSSELLSKFSNAITKNFQSEVQLLNFAMNVEAAKTINKWVEEKTNNKIKELINENDLDDLTRMVLVNAIYFKGDWKYQFVKRNTNIQPFYKSEEQFINVEMMHLKHKFHYKKDKVLDAQILEMPYVNEKISMIIILPNKRTGIGELEAQLGNADLNEILKGLHFVQVEVDLPKFKIEQTIDLKEALFKIGLGEIFDEDKANFRGMMKLEPNENLFVSKAIQKAYIEVNEEGAEAAAATGAVMRMTRSLIIPTNFCADHPFIFYIVETVHETETYQRFVNKLFTGKLTDLPAATTEKHDEL